MCESESCSVESNSLWPHRLRNPWNSPGQNTGVGSFSLLQGISPTHGLNPGLLHCRQILYQLSYKGSSRILEWVTYPFSSRFSQPRNWTGVPCIAGGFFSNWAIREAWYICICHIKNMWYMSWVELIWVEFSRSVVSDSLWTHGLQHTRPPCPSPAPGVYSNSCPLSWWYHCQPFSSCLQSFPASRSFPTSQFFASGGQSIGVSASASVLPMNIQDWFPLGWTGWISSQSLGLLLHHHSSKALILWCSAFFIGHISHPYMTTGKTVALTRWTFVGKVMSLLFNMLPGLVITFFPRSKHLLVSWLKSPTAVILEAPKIKSVTVSTVSPSIYHEVMGPDAMIVVSWTLSFKSTFSLSSFTFIKRLFSSSSISAIRVVSSAYLKLLIFLLAVLIPACASSSPEFLMMYSAYKLNKQGDNIQPWCTPFPIWNQSVVPCPVLTVASWRTYRFLRTQVR